VAEKPQGNDMSTNRSFGEAGGGYSTTVSLGNPPSGPAASPPAQDGLIRDTTTARFSADVIQESRKQPVLVDFWAPWCGPCKQLTPALEKIVREAGGRVKLVKMNIDEHPAIAGQLGIQSIPAVIAFANGQPVDGFMGAVPESQIRDFIARLGGADPKAAIADALAAAAQAKEQGDAEAAMQIFAQILSAQPDNIDAIAGLAALYLDMGENEAAVQLLDQAPPESAKVPAVAAVRARLALAQQVASLGDPSQLLRRLERDPKDHEARFDLAMIQNAQGERLLAADNLLAIMKSDRSWRDDGARAQLLQFFEAWGMTDPATLAARRKLSSLLFS
jgi:putative thioredoxin